MKVAGEGHRVTTFELFFDLVFVFAFTQVTEFMAHGHSAVSVLQAMIILGLLWWSWCSYAWLANQTHVDEGIVRIGMSVSMGAMFVVALVIPEGFVDLPGGGSGPVTLVVAYFIVRLVHVGLYLVAAGDDVALKRQVLRTSLSMLLSVGLLFTGALIGGAAQTWFWLAALVADIVLTYVTSNGGDWRVNSAAHWAERYGLVIILALGESVVAIGVGAAHEPISVPILVGSLLAITLSISLWWLYFDRVATAAEHRLAAEKGARRAALATDAYTYIHLVLIAGIVVLALGVEQVLGHAAEAEPLGLFGAAALYGGIALYLLGHSLFWRRIGGTWRVLRLVGALLLLLLLPLGALLQPLAALALAVAVPVAAAVLEGRASPAGRSNVLPAAQPTP